MPRYETLASDAMERIARRLGVRIDLDDPETALTCALSAPSQNCSLSRPRKGELSDESR